LLTCTLPPFSSSPLPPSFVGFLELSSTIPPGRRNIRWQSYKFRHVFSDSPIPSAPDFFIWKTFFLGPPVRSSLIFPIDFQISLVLTITSCSRIVCGISPPQLLSLLTQESTSPPIPSGMGVHPRPVRRPYYIYSDTRFGLLPSIIFSSAIVGFFLVTSPLLLGGRSPAPEYK